MKQRSEALPGAGSIRYCAGVRALLMSVTLLVAACSGSGTSAPSGNASAAPTSAVSPSAATPDAPRFGDLVRMGTGASFKITYRFSAGAAGATVVEQSWYVKGGLSRWDLRSPGGTGSSMYYLADGAYHCVLEGQAMCLKLAGGQSAPPNAGMLFQEQLRQTPDRFAATPRASRSIAGMPAQCYSVTDASGSGTFGEGVSCLSAQGLLLLSEFNTPTGMFKMEAASASTSVSDNDFKLPAPVRSQP